MTRLSSRAKALVSALLGPFVAAHQLDLRFLQHRLGRKVIADSISASAVSTMHDQPGPPNEYLLDLAPRLIHRCRQEALPLLRDRGAPSWVFCWPGEHYRLLAAIVSLIGPNVAVEIGTSTGLSALSVLPNLPPGGRLYTIDIVPWNAVTSGMGKHGGSYLVDSDFASERLVQVISNLAEPTECEKLAAVLRTADLLFIDGPKDGRFEQAFLRNFAAIGPKPGAVLLFDDIRLFNMLAFWRAIEKPKLDFTSFGHYAGTGLIHWQ